MAGGVELRVEPSILDFRPYAMGYGTSGFLRPEPNVDLRKTDYEAGLFAHPPY
jgi:hypothetical protein